uniref:Leucine rich repeats-containing protein n=1 Tax=Trepomonas sp. PC1 TaxID=1076344 RepID=A0A146KB62_9EUKA|eukprot:JAP93508.1 Leucine rich repeats-containing protein [Trepomonas sp. PC1]
MVVAPHLQRIGESAFEDSYVNFVISSKISHLENSAFYGATFLKHISLRDAEHIGQNCFSNCYNLKNVENDVCTSLGQSSFSYCKNLFSISFKQLQSLDCKTFSESCICNVDLPQVTEVQNLRSLFQNCVFSDMTKRELFSKRQPENIQHCEIKTKNQLENLFKWLPRLCFGAKRATQQNAALFYLRNAILLPENVEIVETGAFEGFQHRVYQIFAPGVTQIEGYAFNKLPWLRECHFPQLVKTGWGAFYQSVSLTKFFARKLQLIGRYTFEYSGLEYVKFPEVVEVQEAAFSKSKIVKCDLQKVKTIQKEAFAMTQVSNRYQSVIAEGTAYIGCTPFGAPKIKVRTNEKQIRLIKQYMELFKKRKVEY